MWHEERGIGLILYDADHMDLALQIVPILEKLHFIPVHKQVTTTKEIRENVLSCKYELLIFLFFKLLNGCNIFLY